jgi:hypothetical protein
LPRNKRHGNVATEERPTTDTATVEETSAVTTVEATDEIETDTTPNFSFDVAPAPADFEPNRKSPGRQRRPSPFDEVLKADNVFGKGWQRVPFTSEEHKLAIKSELERAKSHLGVGLDLDMTQDDAVYFKSRELQKRDRTKENGNGNGALAENQGEADPDGDNDE